VRPQFVALPAADRDADNVPQAPHWQALSAAHLADLARNASATRRATGTECHLSSERLRNAPGVCGHEQTGLTGSGRVGA